MAVTDFTSYNDIRAALGVSADEIEDTTLSLPLYEYDLTSELEAVSLGLITDFKALTGDPLTEPERRLKESVILFATYSVAAHLTVSLPLFSPKEIGDGKAHITRYATNPYRDTIDAVNAKLESHKARVVAVYAAFKVTTAAPTTFRTYITAVAPGSDPVTGT